jgi:hypothetical protein
MLSFVELLVVIIFSVENFITFNGEIYHFEANDFIIF